MSAWAVMCGEAGPAPPVGGGRRRILDASCGVGPSASCRGTSTASPNPTQTRFRRADASFAVAPLRRRDSLRISPAGPRWDRQARAGAHGPGRTGRACKHTGLVRCKTIQVHNAITQRYGGWPDPGDAAHTSSQVHCAGRGAGGGKHPGRARPGRRGGLGG